MAELLILKLDKLPDATVEYDELGYESAGSVRSEPCHSSKKQSEAEMFKQSEKVPKPSQLILNTQMGPTKKSAQR